MLAEQDVTPSMRHDAKKHKLSTDDVRELRQIFEMFDTDQSGTIDAAELADVMRTVGLNPTPDELAAYVRQADVDGDGQISYPEFADLMAACKQRSKDSELRDAFDFFDQTRDGSVTPAELYRQLRAVGMGVTEAECDTMIRMASDQVDARGRPQVTFDQLVAYLE